MSTAAIIDAPRTSKRHLALVRSATAFMLENIGEPLAIEHVCQAVRTKPRTLLYAFKRVAGVGPMAYWKFLRLKEVRRSLQSRDNAHLRIFDVAVEFGFWHHGHFCREYKSMFGETPSKTRGYKLRRF